MRDLYIASMSMKLSAKHNVWRNIKIMIKNISIMYHVDFIKKKIIQLLLLMIIILYNTIINHFSDYNIYLIIISYIEVVI